MLQKVREAMSPKKSKKNESKDCVSRVKEDLSDFRKQFEGSWKRYDNVFYGDIWQHGQYRPFENEIAPILIQQVAKITDSQPGVVISSQDPDHEDKAENLSKSVEWVMRNQKFTSLYPALQLAAHRSAPGYMWIDFDHFACDGDGEITFEQLDWDQVYIDGMGESCRVELKRSKSKLKQMFPKFAEQIDELEGDKGSYGSENGGRETRDTNKKHRRQRPKPYQSKKILKLIYTFEKDLSLEKIPAEDTEEELVKEREAIAEGRAPDIRRYQDHDAHYQDHMQDRAEVMEFFGLAPDAPFEEAEQLAEQIAQESQGEAEDVTEMILRLKVIDNHLEEHQILKEENPNSQRPKYPGGYRVVKTIGEGLVVYDGKNEFDHGKIPLAILKCYDDGTAHGFGEICNLYDTQAMSAEMLWKTWKGLKRVANPSMIIDIETELGEEDISNEDGAKYFLPRGTDIRFMQPGQISNQVVGFVNERTEKMRQISGSYDASQGEMPSGNASGVTVKRLQMATDGRQRLKERQSFDSFFKFVAEITASNIIQFWTTEKVLDVEDYEGEKRQVLFSPFGLHELKWEAKIAPGTLAGVDKDMVNGLYYALLVAGAIDVPMFAELAQDIPRIEKLAEMMGEKQQTQAQLEEMQAQILEYKTQLIEAGLMAPEEITPEEEQIINQGV